mmetsp:Transcript_103667/g.275823  ORF Transcript_103667/g.275823 Transcript_103667/m.275823 type:complete len:267 (+) Transcript_103667:30-830(+)
MAGLLRLRSRSCWCGSRVLLGRAARGQVLVEREPPAAAGGRLPSGLPPGPQDGQARRERAEHAGGCERGQQGRPLQRKAAPAPRRNAPCGVGSLNDRRGPTVIAARERAALAVVLALHLADAGARAAAGAVPALASALVVGAGAGVLAGARGVAEVGGLLARLELEGARLAVQLGPIGRDRVVQGGVKLRVGRELLHLVVVPATRLRGRLLAGLRAQRVDGAAHVVEARAGLARRQHGAAAVRLPRGLHPEVGVDDALVCGLRGGG